MFRFAGAAAVLVAASIAAHAHFVFILPDAKEASKALVVFSDELGVDENVTMDKVGGLKLQVKDATGNAAEAKVVKEKHSMAVTVPGSGPRVVYGSVAYGVLQKGDSKPYLLSYHPKAFLGEIPADGGRVGGTAPELVPTAAGGKVKFQLLAGGKPVADAEATVILPDGKKEKTKTDAEGFTKEFAGGGRYGVWVRITEAKAGEHDGKRYDEARHYATLVLDVPAK